jgi:hypothetical protein
MLNPKVGQVDRIQGRSVIRTECGRQGHALYGPYVELPPGRYAVEFNIAPAGEAEGDTICAEVDVVADFGQTTIVREGVAFSRLSKGPVRRPLRSFFPIATTCDRFSNEASGCASPPTT